MKTSFDSDPRLLLFMGFIFLGFSLRLKPVLNCSTVLAASLLV